MMPLREPPLVVAIVLVYGGEDVTAACLDSLLTSDYPSLRILLADNASPDGAGVRLRDRYPQVAYLDNRDNLGYAAGNNRGVAWAAGHGADYVLILNNDTVVEPGCISRLVETAEEARSEADAPLGTVSPKMLYHDLPDHIWFGGGELSRTRAMGRHVGEMEHDDPHEAAKARRITFATGCCILMPAKTAVALGPFDERFFMYCEDVELSIRLGQAGYRMLYQPAARLHHRERPGKPQSSPQQIRWRDRNRRLIASIHFRGLDLLKFRSFFYASRAVRCAQYLARRQWTHAAAVVDAALR